jgi:hypothetical protein
LFFQPFFYSNFFHSLKVFYAVFVVYPRSPFCKVFDFGAGEVIALKAPLQPFFFYAAFVDSASFVVVEVFFRVASAAAVVFVFYAVAAVQAAWSSQIVFVCHFFHQPLESCHASLKASHHKFALLHYFVSFFFLQGKSGLFIYFSTS